MRFSVFVTVVIVLHSVQQSLSMQRSPALRGGRGGRGGFGGSGLSVGVGASDDASEASDDDVAGPDGEEASSSITGSGNTDSTESRYATYFDVKKKWMKMYIAETKYSVEDATNWLKFEHGKWLPDEDKAIRYLKWFHDGVMAHKDKGNTPSNFLKLLVACQDFYKKQLRSKGLKSVLTVLPKGFTSSLSGVDTMTKSMTKKQQNMQTAGDVDMQSNLNALVPKDKMLEGARFLFSFATTRDFSYEPLLRFTFQATLRTSIGLACRGEELRFARLATIFTRRLSIGPHGSYTTALCLIGNQGKQNRCGRTAVSSAIPHWNVLLCPLFSISMQLIYRFVIYGEQFPVVTDYQTLFGSYLFRSTVSNGAAASYDTISKCFTDFFSHQRLVVCALTHYGRHEGIAMMGEEGVSEANINQHCNIYEEVSKASYRHQTNLPATIACAGGNPRDVEGDRPAHVTDEVLDSITSAAVHMVLPCIAAQEAALKAALEGLYSDGSTFAEAKKKKEQRCLYSAEGFINAIIFLVRVFIACTAARPRDEFGDIIVDSLPMYLLFPQNPVFQLAFFRTDLFKSICAVVKASEDEEIRRRGRMRRAASAASGSQAAASSTAAPTVPGHDEPAVTQQLHEVHADVKEILRLQVASQANQCSFPPWMCPWPMPPTALSGGSVPFGPFQIPLLAAAVPSLQPMMTLPMDCGPINQNTASGKRRAASHTSHVDGNKGHVNMRDLGDARDIEDFCVEYFDGTNGGLSIEKLELTGTKWRGYKGGKQLFSKKRKLALYMRGLFALHTRREATAIAQAILDSIPKRGPSEKPNWAAFMKQVCPPKKRSHSDSGVLEASSDEDDGEETGGESRGATRLRGDASIIEDAACPAQEHSSMAMGTGI